MNQTVKHCIIGSAIVVNSPRTSVKLLYVLVGNAVSYLIKKTVIVTGRPKAVLSLQFHLFYV